VNASSSPAPENLRVPSSPGPGRPRLAALRQSLLVLSLYGLIAIGLFAPMASNAIMPGSEQINHVGVIVQARKALWEGQFPIRIAPWQHNGWQYPLFQFYSPLPYTIGGLVYGLITPQNPFIALKIALWMALVTGAFFIYLTAAHLTRSRPAALLAGVIYMTAPYWMINVHARGAFTEAVAQGVIPIVIYYSLRCYEAPRLSWEFWAAALAWCGLALTHNLTYIWTSFFAGVLFLALAIRRRGVAPGLWRLGAAFAWGCVLAIYFLAPVISADYLNIRDHYLNVFEFTWSTPIATLLAPVSLPPEPQPGHIATPFLHASVGWPMLLGFGLAIYLSVQSPFKEMLVDLRARRMVTTLAVLFVLAFVLTWSPVDFWAVLPPVVSVAQFSYRLLAQVSWIGALLAAYALVLLFRGALTLPQTVAGLLLIMVAHGSFLPPMPSAPAPFTPAHIVEWPDSGYGRIDYLAAASRFVTLSGTAPPAADLALPMLIDAEQWLRLDAPVDVPREFFRDCTDCELDLDGEMPGGVGPGPITLSVLVNGRVASKVQLAPGTVHVGVPLRGLLAADPSTPALRLAFTVDRAFRAHDLDPSRSDTRRLAVARASVVVRHLVPIPVMRVSALQLSCLREVELMHCHIPIADHATNVQLPALFYPDMQQVEVDGRSARFFPIVLNELVLTGVQLEPGVHDLTIRFHGVTWANRVSAFAWIVTAIGLAWPLARSRRQPAAGGLAHA
jgi:hypothetical protein